MQNWIEDNLQEDYDWDTASDSEIDGAIKGRISPQLQKFLDKQGYDYVRDNFAQPVVDAKRDIESVGTSSELESYVRRAPRDVVLHPSVRRVRESKEKQLARSSDIIKQRLESTVIGGGATPDAQARASERLRRLGDELLTAGESRERIAAVVNRRAQQLGLPNVFQR